MPDYSQGKIYKVIPIQGIWRTLPCYVGSTVERYLSRRMAGHKYDYKLWKEGKDSKCGVYDLFEQYGVDNCYIILIENYPCSSKDELKAREEYWREKIATVNINKAFIPPEDRGQKYKKQYREDNKEHIKEYAESYRKKIRDEKVQCECGSNIKRPNLWKHNQSKKHEKFIQNKELGDTPIAPKLSAKPKIKVVLKVAPLDVQTKPIEDTS
jgi:hypothetical protein